MPSIPPRRKSVDKGTIVYQPTDTEVEADSPSPVCEDVPYRRYEPGIYEVVCLGARTYKDPRFRAWKTRLTFQINPAAGDGKNLIYGFLHLGNGTEPKAGRGSEYRRCWILANDGQPPLKRQRMSDRVFKGR